MGEDSVIGFNRVTQLGLLRLLTTASVMGDKPLTNAGAWAVYDELCKDHRVQMFLQDSMAEHAFRTAAGVLRVSPKIWIDCYLAFFAAGCGARVVTFDKALRGYGVECLLLGSETAR